MNLSTVYGPAYLKSRFLDGIVVRKCLVDSHLESPTSNMISFHLRTSSGAAVLPVWFRGQSNASLSIPRASRPPGYPTSGVILSEP